MPKKKLPSKTINRLSVYRRLLSRYKYLSEPHIFSHDLARMLKRNPVQVRRDLLDIGFKGNHQKGYNVNELINLIDKTLTQGEIKNMALVGSSNWGNAIIEFLHNFEYNSRLVAFFDDDFRQASKDLSGIPCFDISKIYDKV